MRLVIPSALRRIALGLSAALPLLLSGCWSKQELNDRSFVSTLMIDRTEEGLTEVSAMFLLPNRVTTGLTSSTTSQKPYALVSGRGRDIAEAFQRFQRDLPRYVTWGHMQVIIVGDRYARAGLDPLLDFLVRMPDFRLRVYVYYFDGEARDLSRVSSLFERFPTEIWREFAHMKQAPPVQSRELLYAQWNNLGDGYLPGLNLRHKDIPTEREGVEWSGVAPAAMIKDNKVTDLFTEEETTGVLLLNSRVPETVFTVPIPGPGNGLASARLVDVKQRTGSSRRGDRVTVRTHIRAEADLITIQSALDLTEPVSIRKIERAIEERLRELATAAARKARAHQADAFQWSEYVKYGYPSLWKRWSGSLRENLAENVVPQIDVRVHLRNTGESRSSLTDP